VSMLRDGTWKMEYGKPFHARFVGGGGTPTQTVRS
jgi:hypothetical protein